MNTVKKFNDFINEDVNKNLKYSTNTLTITYLTDKDYKFTTLTQLDEDIKSGKVISNPICLSSNNTSDEDYENCKKDIKENE